MSCVSWLDIEEDYMVTWCPGCGKRIEVDDEDYYATLADGTKEYEIECSCGCSFYANVNYR